MRSLLLAAAVWALAVQAVLAGDETALTTGWRFVRADVAGAQAVGFDDGQWRAITVPHTYNVEDSTIGGAKARGEPEGVYYRGPAWYRLTLKHTPKAATRYYLQFGGAALKADVFLNGQPLGAHEGGYAAFRFDVTDALKAGDNLLAVRVDNAKNPRYAPLNGDFNIFGGLHRPVSLIAAPDLHIDRMDHAGPGVYARTAELSARGAKIEARILLKNDRGQAARFDVVTRILDAQGQVVARARAPQALAAGQGAAVTQTFVLAKPKLWEGRKGPYLYQVRSEIVAGGAVVDSVAVPLGVRTVAITKDGRFWLNGKPYGLYGANLQHPTRPGKGTVVSDADIDEDMRLMDEMGVTGLRLAHMQHPPRVYEDADRLGILLSTEPPLVDDIDPSDAFRENLVQQMRELIAQNYNHPSVAMWGVGNELRTSSTEANVLLAALQTTAKTLDPMRPTVYAHCCLKDDDPIAQHSDAVSYNRYFGWYWDESAAIGKWADELHAKLPNRPFGVSEYGAGASILQQEDPVMKRPDPNGYWHPEQYQAVFHEVHWREMKKRPFLWSQFIWVGIDFPSFKRNEGDRPAINDKGLVTEDRKVRKDAYYWYQANWTQAPMVHVTSPRDVDKRTQHVKVKVYSNQPEVSLSLNGGPARSVKVDDHIARWETDLKVGDNTITATVVVNGRPLTDTVRWTYGVKP